MATLALSPADACVQVSNEWVLTTHHTQRFPLVRGFVEAILPDTAISKVGAMPFPPSGSGACDVLYPLLTAVATTSELLETWQQTIKRIEVHCSVSMAPYEVELSTLRVYRIPHSIDWGPMAAQAHAGKIAGLSIFDGTASAELEEYVDWARMSPLRRLGTPRDEAAEITAAVLLGNHARIERIVREHRYSYGPERIQWVVSQLQGYGVATSW